ncbi:MAG: ATP-binding cassette domain-containing protein [Rhizobium sp.]
MDVAAGQRLLVCGSAGSGKTTLLNAAAGIIPRLVKPETISGDIDFDGRPITAIPKDDLFTAISIVSQNVEDQIWDLSVEDLIAFPLENRAFSKTKVRARIRSLMADLEIEELSGRRVLTLSGGERRMVAIAAALAAAPKLLVLDEPTTGLDPAARKRLVCILQKLNAEIPALLISEQDPAAIAGIVDEIALLNAGTLSQPASKHMLMQQERPWLEAGVLPPRRKQSRHKNYPEGATLLSVAGLKTKLARANGRPVLENVDFDIRAGESLALIGRNGAGKTTLFQSILGLTEIAGGTLAIEGQDAAKWTPARRARSIAYVPQNMRRILFNMTVLQEVTFAITATTAAPKDPAVTDKAMAALEKYGLEAQRDTNPFALSTRQQALLGLACADAAGSVVAILDEPLLARDLNGRRMLDLFFNNALATGRAIMLITHDLELVADVASRVLVLDQGRMTFDGATEAVWQSEGYRALGWQAPEFTMATGVDHAHS